jgi:hypothetical protein
MLIFHVAGIRMFSAGRRFTPGDGCAVPDDRWS